MLGGIGVAWQLSRLPSSYSMTDLGYADYGGGPAPAAGGTVRQLVKVQQGIPTDKAKEIVKFIKDGKYKVQASIQGDAVRIQGAKRDDLQDCIALIRKEISDFPIKAGNFRD